MRKVRVMRLFYLIKRWLMVRRWDKWRELHVDVPYIRIHHDGRCFCHDLLSPGGRR